MAGSKLTIGVVNYNTADFVENLVYCLKRLTHHEFQLLVCDNGSRFLDRRRIRALANANDEIQLMFREQTAGGSQGHGEALNVVMDRFDTEFGAILDADATFLKRGWDRMLIDRLDDEVKIVGAPHVENPTKPTDFPSVFASVFEVDAFESVDIDMRPDDPSSGRDTGWEIREKFLEVGFSAECLVPRNTREFTDGPFRDVLCVEYYLSDLDDIIGSHFSRGATYGAAKYFKGGFLGHPIIGFIPKRVRGYREKRKWMDVCREIVDSQVST